MAVMMTPRETWTDQRLDDLNTKVDEGFKKVDARLGVFETQIDARLDRFETRMENDIREMRRMMFQGFFTLVVSGFFGLIAF